MKPDSHSFRKAERIVSQKQIDLLFGGHRSHSLTAYPLRAVYATTDHEHLEGQQPPVQVLISVPKKHFRHAVDRNRVKRQVREAYRLNKQLLWQAVPPQQQVLLAFIWLSDRHLPSSELAHRVTTLLQRIARQL